MNKTNYDTTGQSAGFQAGLRGLESLVKKAMQQHANLTLNIFFVNSEIREEIGDLVFDNHGSINEKQ
jgi:hypothetical protein